jgi:hypothetical protein
MGTGGAQCFLRVNTKGLCHGSQEVAKVPNHGERQKFDRQAKQIQDRIYALVLRLLCDTLAGRPQFFRLRVFRRAGFWCHDGNGCGMAFEFWSGGPSESGHVTTRLGRRSCLAKFHDEDDVLSEAARPAFPSSYWELKDSRSRPSCGMWTAPVFRAMRARAAKMGV